VRPQAQGLRLRLQVDHVPLALRGLVAAVRATQAPAGVATRIVAIDGPGCAGKSSLARWLAGELDAPIVHTDDFASWENPVDWWPELIARALEPLAAGQPARYVPTSWGGEERAPVLISPAVFVILEGVTASREAFRPYLAYSVWIETPREVRLQRGLERDGEQARAQWEQWMEAEDRYVERERPAEHADSVLPGDEELWPTGPRPA
jgi:uridine kinase